MNEQVHQDSSRHGGRHNNLNFILGVFFAAAALSSDYQKSGLSASQYVGKKADAVVAAVFPSATAQPNVPAAK